MPIKFIWSVNSTDMDHQPFWHNMLHLTLESFAQYGSSNIGGYQFVNHDICIYHLFYILFSITKM